MVPGKITTNNRNSDGTSGGTSGGTIGPGLELLSYIGQVIKEGITAQLTNIGSSTLTTKITTNKENFEEPTWWCHFNTYCPTCGVNLQHDTKHYSFQI